MLTLFDFDGTLCDTRQAILAGLRDLIDAMLDQPLSDDILIDHIRKGMSLHATIRSLHPQPESIEPEIDRWAMYYRDAYARHAIDGEALYPSAAEAVITAAELGSVVIVSMKHSDELLRSVERLQLTKHVDAIFGDDGVSPLKPTRELWTEAIWPLFPHIPAERTLMIGDTAHDLQFARNAGVRSCWAAYGFGHEELANQVGYDTIAHSAADMIHIIAEQQERRSSVDDRGPQAPASGLGCRQ